MKKSRVRFSGQALADFKELCHQYFTCYYFAVMGVENVALKFAPLATTPDSKLTLGYGTPRDGHAVAQINLQQAIDASAPDGLFADMLGKALLVKIFEEWREHASRHIADELRIERTALRCDLMDDLKILRYWIALKHSVVDDKIKKIRALDWQFQQGEPFTITRDMFSRFIDQVNDMQVYRA